jgi:hypothetical protein
MKPYLVLFVVLLIGIGISCKKDPIPNDLKGRWVRVDNRNDTVTFGFKDQANWFELFRGYQIGDDGISRPKIPLGIYEYKLKDSSILIHWSASSSSTWPEYFFSLHDSEIEIGNFIDNTNPKIILEKIK